MTTFVLILALGYLVLFVAFVKLQHDSWRLVIGGQKVINLRLDATTLRLDAISSRLDAIATRLDTLATLESQARRDRRERRRRRESVPEQVAS